MPSTPWEWPGARWWRCDLHLHTPASHDFQDQDATAGEWIERAVGAGLDVVAVTDHDQAGFVSEARAAAGDRLTVLAGVELTSSEGVHLLVLLGEAADEDSIRSLLGACGVPAAEWGTGPARATEPLLRCMEIAAGPPHHGLCITAHADSEVTERNPSTASLLRGSLDPRTLRRVLASPHLCAVEVWGDDEAEHLLLRGLTPDRGARRAPGLALARFSDAHALDEIGRRSTWIKMTRPTHEGLRLAFCDGDHSVRAVVDSEDANDAPGWVIESLWVAEAKHIGRSAPLEIVFNPWLTTIIGGRGSGKTSVVNLLRTALDQRDAAGEVKNALDLFLQVGGRDVDGALTANTAVKVTYRKDGARFRASWTTGGEAATLEQERGGEWVPAEGSVATRLPVQILGQGEIHETARKPRALLGIVDRASAVARAEWQQEFDTEVARFLALRAQTRQVATNLARESETRGELADVGRSLEVFAADEHRDALAMYQQRYAQQQAVNRFVAHGRDIVEALRDTVDGLSELQLDSGPFSTGSVEDADLLSLAAGAADRTRAALQSATEAATSVEAALDDFLTRADASSWKQAARAADDAYRALVEDLKAAGVDDPQRYGELVQRQQTLEQRLEEYATQGQRADALRSQADEAFQRVVSLRIELSERRERFLAELLHDNPLVRIEVRRLDDTDGVPGDLRDLLGIEVSFEQDIDRIAALLGAGGDPPEDCVMRLKERVRSIAAGDSTHVADNRFRTRLEGLNEEALDRLDTWFPEDRLIPSYSRGHGRFEALSRGSAGQQNAAILAFLLSHGSEPIVIDQPESDLDNSLITDLVVAQLLQIKPRRQVILVTHNPNIVVNADAELVASLELPAGEVCVEVGGLQEEAVRSVVCEVMEGGQQAFEARYSRIGERTTSRRA